MTDAMLYLLAAGIPIVIGAVRVAYLWEYKNGHSAGLNWAMERI